MFSTNNINISVGIILILKYCITVIWFLKQPFDSPSSISFGFVHVVLHYSLEAEPQKGQKVGEELFYYVS